MALILGVDPGKSGGWCVLQDGLPVSWGRIPLIGREVDWRALANVFGEDVTVLAIERVVPGVRGGLASSRAAAGWLSQTWGLWVGAAAANGCAIHSVLASSWQAEMGVHADDYGARKKEAVRAALALFPALAEPLKVKANWCIADAALIAECVRRRIR